MSDVRSMGGWSAYRNLPPSSDGVAQFVMLLSVMTRAATISFHLSSDRFRVRTHGGWLTCPSGGCDQQDW
jgi:hypothetical protein